MVFPTSDEAAANTSRRFPTTYERVPLAALFAVAAAFRVAVMLRYRIDSDEPQHLHVVWGWAHGLVQYRDVFDNHLPLFHMLFAPLMAISGERPDILLLGRLWIAPVSLATLLIAWLLARGVFDARTAVWSVLFLSVTPPLLLKGVEFRNDNLWMLAWMLALLYLCRREARGISLFAAGLFLGVALAISLKTGVLLAALAVAWLATEIIVSGGLSLRKIEIRGLVLIAAGLVAVPLATAAFIWSRGALADMIDCAWDFNASMPVSDGRRIAGALSFLPLLALLIGYARNRRWQDRFDARQLFLSVLALVYPLVLVCFWPLITTRDLLPAIPLLVMAATYATRARTSDRWLAAVSVALMVCTVVGGDLWRSPDLRPQRVIEATLALTSENDAVFDLKGETIFRRRPVHFILESVGRRLIRSGQVADTIPEQLIARRCHVAIDDYYGNLPPRTLAFLENHYVRAEPFYVSGAIVTLEDHQGEFDIAVPGPYVVTGPGSDRAEIDGAAVPGPVWLEAGRHVLVAAPERAAIVVAWAPAVERGFGPALESARLAAGSGFRPRIAALQVKR